MGVMVYLLSIVMAKVFRVILVPKAQAQHVLL